MVPRPIKRWLQEPLEGVFGTAAARQRHLATIRGRPGLREALATIDRRWPTDANGAEPDDDPILIFAAAWRSGSTLLQRLILSGQEALIWGEPYAHCDYIRRLASSLNAFDVDAPPDQFFMPDSTDNRPIATNEWTACLYPHPRVLREAHRAFFRTLYRDSARARGYARWGLKEVVLSTDEAAYLAWLFPAARFVFLVRNPYDAYRSYRAFRDWYFQWPDQPVFTAGQFGRVWRSLTDGFLRDHARLGGLLLRYEDLVSGRTPLESISSHLGTPLSGDVLDVSVTGRPQAELSPIPRLERYLLRRAVEPLAAQLGYVEAG